MRLSKDEIKDVMDLIILNCEEQDKLLQRIYNFDEIDQEKILTGLSKLGDLSAVLFTGTIQRVIADDGFND